MDRKKTKRRKSGAGKRNGKRDEKPNSPEVMNEKEKQDRLEAASALSSLMFFPPKPTDNENDEVGKPVTPSASVTQFTAPATVSGIPTTSQITSLVQGMGGRGGTGASLSSDKASSATNSLILAHLQNQLSLALKNRNMQPIVNTTPSSSAILNVISHDKPQTKDLKEKKESQNVPLTVLPNNVTVNQNVAKALREVVSSNKLKAAESPQSNDTLQKNNTGNTDTTSTPPSSTENEHEKMDCDNLPTSKKNENLETKLPLKKRRLIGVVDDSLSAADLTLTSSVLNANLGTLNSARQLENILQMARDYPVTSTNSTMNLNLISGFSQTKSKPGEGYRPVQVDPRTSLMVLSDLKYALTPDEDGDLPLHIAVVHENTELVKRFIDIMAISGKTVDRFNKLQQTPLHLAVLVNKPDIIELLLEAGANPNLLDRNGYTSVHIAVNKEFPKCMDTVFRNSKFPVNLNTRHYEGYYPLHTCVELNNLEIMKSLIEQGADKDCQDGKAGRSVLLYAVEYNRSEIVKYLLDQGVNPEAQNYAGVTPLMTAQAANMDEITSHLNKALDLLYKYDESYIPSKKVQIARIPSKNAQIVKKDPQTGKTFLKGKYSPLIYEEYAETEPMSELDHVEVKREPLSRQSSVSSPIDLSMRGNSESPLPPPQELSIRGKPGRRKTKKESKNHKEKQPQKSMLKENHATVVAALESTSFVEKSYAVKANSKAKNIDNKAVEQPHIKEEKEDREYDSTRKPTEKEDILDKETIRMKSSSEAFSNLILSLGPEQAKHLVQQVKQQYGVSLRTYGPSTLVQNAAIAPVFKNLSSQVMTNSEIQQETNSEKMQVDSETSGQNFEKHDEDNGYVKNINIKGDIASKSVDVTEKNIGNTVDDKERMENGDVVNVIADTEVIESPVGLVQSESRLEDSEKNDMEDKSMDTSDVRSVENNKSMDTSDVRSVENISKLDTVKKSEENLTNSSLLSEEESDNIVMDDTGGEEDISDKTVDDETEMEDIQNSVRETADGDININIPQRVCEKNTKTIENCSSNEKPSVREIFVSQMSHDSGSNCSSQGSQGSKGFEISSSGLELRSPPVSNNNDLFAQSKKPLYHSESTMEVEFSGMEAKENHQIITVTDKKTSKSGSEKRLDSEDKETESIVEEKLSGTSMDTDEDEDESGLVIDEHASEDESVTIANNEQNAIVSSETVVKNSKVDEDVGTDQSSVDKGVSEKSIDNDKETSGKSASVIGDEAETGKSGKELQGTKLNSQVKDTRGTESQSAGEMRDISKLDDVANFVTSSCSLTGISSQTINVVSLKGPSESPQSTTVMTKPEISKGLFQSDMSEDLMKKGQAHTLYYRDGDGYKPVKIFIDNSEQSSLVLQRMFQTAQLSNPRKQVGVVAPGGIKEPASQSTVSQMKNLTKMIATNSKTVSSQSAQNTVSSVLRSESASASEKLNYKTTVSYSSSLVPTSNVTVASLSSSSVPTSNVTVASLSSNSSVTSKDLSFQQAYIESIKTKSGEGSTTIGNIEQNKKRSVGNAAKKQVIQSFVKIDNKAKTTPEGTLTRVNPDIRSKLSKALQSPQRKVGLVKSDSESCIVNSRGLLGGVPCTVNTSVTDSRQQL